MSLETMLSRWTSALNEGTEIPTRVVLWTGQRFDFGHFASPAVTIHVRDADALAYLLEPSLDRLGEAYVKGKIDFEGRLADVMDVGYSLARKTLQSTRHLRQVKQFFSHSKRSDRKSIQLHYDMSNEFFSRWLDPNMVYSCAYFEHGNEDLATAQLKKIDHILVKIKLQPDQRLLDIGCGWGTLVLRAARKFGARCVGITLSEQQCELARERVRAAGLEQRVEIRLQDYRDVGEQFDRVTSVGMFEHVGIKHLPDYFSRIRHALADHGLALNHGITSAAPDHTDTTLGGGDFIDRYVFPNGELPHIGQVLQTMQEGGLEAIDVENLRRHYALTLERWADNFERESEAIRRIVDEEKFRVWRVYLAGCSIAFRQDALSIYQVLCQKAGRAADSLDWSRRYMYRPD